MTADTKVPIKTKVTCAFSVVEEPYDHRYSRETVVSTVLTASIEHFKASPEPGFELYLTHDRTRLANDVSLGSVVGESDDLRCRLVKEIIQG
jgi:hypothetical protein